MPDQQGLGDNGTDSARLGHSSQGDDQMDEQHEEVAHPGDAIRTSKPTAFRPIWQFAMDRLREFNSARDDMMKERAQNSIF
jgi:hypothetical protein